jgi:hypothetical protein
VKWRAARARMQYLLSPVAKKSEDQGKDKSKEAEKPLSGKTSAEKTPTEKPPTGQNKPENSDAVNDRGQNKSANAEKDQKPAAEDAAKNSDTGQKSKRE